MMFTVVNSKWAVENREVIKIFTAKRKIQSTVDMRGHNSHSANINMVNKALKFINNFITTERDIKLDTSDSMYLYMSGVYKCTYVCFMEPEILLL